MQYVKVKGTHICMHYKKSIDFQWLEADENKEKTSQN
jgi:hypothetical protein